MQYQKREINQLRWKQKISTTAKQGGKDRWERTVKRSSGQYQQNKNGAHWSQKSTWVPRTPHSSRC